MPAATIWALLIAAAIAGLVVRIVRVQRWRREADRLWPPARWDDIDQRPD